MPDVLEEASPPADESPKSSAGRARLTGLDAARGVAFLGMVVVNFHVVMSLLERDPAWLAAAMDAPSSRASATFVTLAGIGLTLLFRAARRRVVAPRGRMGRLARALPFLGFLAVCGTWNVAVATAADSGTLGPDGVECAIAALDTEAVEGGVFVVGAVVLVLAGLLVFVGEYDGPRWVIARRALFLLAIGYSWYPLFSGDILHFYGFYLLLALPLLSAPRWVLGVAGSVALGAAIAWQGGHEFWAEYDGDLDYRGFWTLAGAARATLFNGWHPLAPWMAFLTLGLLLGRLDLTRRRTAATMAALGVLVATVTLLAGAPLARFAETLAFARTAAPLHVSRHRIPDGAVPASDGKSAALTNPRRPDVNVVVSEALSAEERARLGPLASRVGAGFYEGFGAGLPLKVVSVHLGPLALRGVEAARVALRLEFPVGATADERQAARDLVAHRLALWMKGEAPHSVRRVFALTGDPVPQWPGELESVGVETWIPHTLNDGGPARWLPVETCWVERTSIEDASPLLENLTEQFRRGAPPHTLGYVLSAGGIAAAVIGLFLLLASLPTLSGVLYPLVCTGRLALTLYLAHVLVFLGALEALGLLHSQGLPMTLLAILVCWLGSVVFATAWCRFFKRGPFEWLMRMLTG